MGRGARAAAEAERRELEKVTRDLDRLAPALIDGAPVSAVKARMEAVKARMEALETRKAELEAAVDRREAPPPALHPRMAEAYRAKVADLASALRAPEARAEAAEILRGLVEMVVLTPAGGSWEILARGDLAGILAVASDKQDAPADVAQGVSQVSMVAGARNQPRLPQPRRPLRQSAS